MTRVRYLFSLVIVLMIHFESGAQDAYFTQTYQAPGQINPALTGTFGGLYRVGFNYRDQWRGGVNSAFQTFSASGDVKFLIGEKAKEADVAAMGIMFLSDRVGLFDYNLTSIGLTGAFHKLLDKRSKQYIGGAIQGSIYQRNLNYEDLTFQDQFNAIDAYTGFTRENLPVNNYGAFDLNLGLIYSISPAKRTNYNVGLSYYHITQSNQSFFAKNNLENKSIDIDFNLYSRLNVHASADLPLSETIQVNPRAVAMWQGPHSQYLIGTLFKFRELRRDNRRFMIGPALRMVTDSQGFNLEAIILQAAFEYNGFILGLSYDTHMYQIIRQNRNVGTLEFSVTFLGEYENEETFCPTF